MRFGESQQSRTRSHFCTHVPLYALRKADWSFIKTDDAVKKLLPPFAFMLLKRKRFITSHKYL
jgi:hypothetical protein